jgi:hypothetical protein
MQVLQENIQRFTTNIYAKMYREKNAAFLLFPKERDLIG